MPPPARCWDGHIHPSKCRLKSMKPGMRVNRGRSPTGRGDFDWASTPRRIPLRHVSWSDVGMPDCRTASKISSGHCWRACVKRLSPSPLARHPRTPSKDLQRCCRVLFGGSADLAGSNLTLWSGSRAVSRNGAGNYLHYGVREFGMAAIMNGMALHRGFIPYGGTFLTFSDYSRNALRMAALMRIRSIFVFTHDSIGLGEDGPTHQPIEHLACWVDSKSGRVAAV